MTRPAHHETIANAEPAQSHSAARQRIDCELPEHDGPDEVRGAQHERTGW